MKSSTFNSETARYLKRTLYFVFFSDRWPSVLSNIDRNDEERFVTNQGPFKGWNYPDALFVGKGGMSDTEYRTMFALWSAVKSPLMLGSDLRNMSINDEAYKVSYY